MKQPSISNSQRTLPIVHGFTLIELLVVVAIIAVLIAVLLPALASVRERTKLTVCQSNFRQLHAAFYGYLTDWHDVFPPSGLLSDWTERRPLWDEALYSYLQIRREYYEPEPELFLCPSRPAGRNYGYPAFYTYNVSLHWSDRPGVRLGQIGRQGKTPVIWDGMYFTDTAWNIDTGGSGAALDRNLELDRHLHGANFLFVDGHIVWIRYAGYRTYFYWTAHENQYFYGALDPDSYWR